MTTGAYGYMFVAMIAALCFGIVRASAIRPTLLLVLTGSGLLVLGFVVGDAAHDVAQGMLPRSVIGVTPQPIVAIDSYGVPMNEGQPLPRGLAVRKGTRMAIEVFDVAEVPLANRPTLQMQRGGTMQISGWAADAEAGRPCKALYLALGSMTIPLPYGLARSDVASHFRDSAYTAVGYSATISTADLPNAENIAKLECLSSGGKTVFVSPDERTLVIQ